MTDDKIVSITSGVPSARLKKLDWSDKRAHCDHRQIEVWPSEPIIECKGCGAVVDPYAWIRARCRDWHQMLEHFKYQQQEAKSELDSLKKSLRHLRMEYDSEVEKRKMESSVMIMPPQRTVKVE